MENNKTTEKLLTELLEINIQINSNLIKVIEILNPPQQGSLIDEQADENQTKVKEK